MATVERGFNDEVLLPARAGDNPSIESSGFSSWSGNCRAYDDKLSTYFLCPSAYTVLKAKEDFPDPLVPVITTNL